MDFGTLLHVAKKNSESSRNETKYYSTKFAPPKKESKDKKLSENIQKFLQKKEHEERERLRVEKEKREQLIAMRDEKSKNKIKKMLKVIKSANKSVLDDAVNSEHTAVTMQGPEQPDQDDYGYVSNEAAAFYQKYIEKVKDVKEDKFFAPSRPQTRTDLMGTKDRVRAAINREHEEKNNHTRTKVSSSTTIATTGSSSTSSTPRTRTSLRPVYDEEAERLEEEKKKREEEQKRKQRKPPPPIMDFQSLLKLAEKKQFEPIVIASETKKKEPERLLTSKERRELEERQKYFEAKERRRNGETSSNIKDKTRGGTTDLSVGPQRTEINGKNAKLNQASSAPAKSTPVTSKNSFLQNSKSNGTSLSKKPPSAPISSSSTMSSKISSNAAQPLTKNSSSLSSLVEPKSGKLPLPKGSKDKSTIKPSSSTSYTKAPSSALANSTNQVTTKNITKTSEFPPHDTKNIKPRQFPPADVQKTRQFPPPDVKRSKPSESRKPQVAQKRRIYDDDSEYDSELDDFIDDGDDEQDYSSHIKEIFGYDRSKYRDIDAEDDRAMESNFAQQQREEFLSKKFGLMEDLEDMRQEALEKKRKASMKKRKL